MTFYPTTLVSPGAYWGWDAAEGPCSEAVLDPLLFTPGSGSDMRVISFEDSVYGIAFDFDTPPTLTPYEIDPTTSGIALGTPVTGPYSLFASDLQSGMVLDDSTMVVQRLVGTTSEYYVVTRSGLSISISGPSAAATVSGGVSFTARLDSSHVIRTYNPPSPNNTHTVVEVCSVSGGSVSVVHSDTIATIGWLATIDPGGGPAAMSTADFYPFHFDGSGTLYAYGQGVGSGALPGPVIFATPFSIGGGIGTIGTSTRAKAAGSVTRITHPQAKIGSSEVLLVISGSKMPMWDDGANMHFTLATSGTWIAASFINHNDEQGDGATTQGDYLTNNIVALPPASTINSGPALVSQSGETLGYSPITPQFLCPQFGTAIFGSRHGSNLGAQLLFDPFADGRWLLRAYKW